jgi:hypothetical protein
MTLAAHLAPEDGGKAPDRARRRPELLAVRTERALGSWPVVLVRRAQMAATAKLLVASIRPRHSFRMLHGMRGLTP